MNVLIVYAHHEPSSLNAALLRVAASTLEAAGHRVTVSDLYAMKFDPVSDRRNFATVFDPNRLSQQAEEAHASRHQTFAPDLASEMLKLRSCDLLIFHFPIWWLGMPAILKGWVDRVFALGVVYGSGRYFDNGVMRGKSAMCIVTVGGLENDYDGSGKCASIETVLYPIHRGILEFAGFEVLPPFVAYGPGRVGPAERRADLMALRARLETVDLAPTSNTSDRHGASAPGTEYRAALPITSSQTDLAKDPFVSNTLFTQG